MKQTSDEGVLGDSALAVGISWYRGCWRNSRAAFRSEMVVLAASKWSSCVPVAVLLDAVIVWAVSGIVLARALEARRVSAGEFLGAGVVDRSL